MSKRSSFYVIGQLSGKLIYKTIHDEIYLLNEEHYSFEVNNYTNRRMTCEIKIGDSHIGKFLIKPKSAQFINRPVDVKNTFKCKDVNKISKEGQELINVQNCNEIYAVCKFEKKPQYFIDGSRGLPAMCDGDDGPAYAQMGIDIVDNKKSSSIGATVLSEKLSTTTYKQVNDIDVDEINVDKYKFKLMIKENLKLSPESKLLHDEFNSFEENIIRHASLY
ncbi:CmNV_058-like protein [Aratus pisonii nudivirus]|nr:CmNV_058-like protein [Aratus pisonii nudivirus]